MEPTHLGDGAYVSEGNYRGEVFITANHHDPAKATDRVYLDLYAVEKLIKWLSAYKAEREKK